MTEINIGNMCTHCGRDTGPGSGLFVNRIPSSHDWYVGDGVQDKAFCVWVDGWMCVDCQSISCEECGQPTPEWEVDEKTGAWWCPDCFENQESDEDL